jgi:hypothetical protein
MDTVVLVPLLAMPPPPAFALTAVGRIYRRRLLAQLRHQLALLLHRISLAETPPFNEVRAPD